MSVIFVHASSICISQTLHPLSIYSITNKQKCAILVPFLQFPGMVRLNSHLVHFPNLILWVNSKYPHSFHFVATPIKNNRKKS